MSTEHHWVLNKLLAGDLGPLASWSGKLEQHKLNLPPSSGLGFQQA